MSDEKTNEASPFEVLQMLCDREGIEKTWNLTQDEFCNEVLECLDYDKKFKEATDILVMLVGGDNKGVKLLGEVIAVHFLKKHRPDVFEVKSET